MKKKNSYEPTTYTAKKGEEAGRNAVKEHAEASKAMQIAADLARSNDNNAVLFAYLLLKRAESKLVSVRDELAGVAEMRDLVSCLNGELKDISGELSRYGLSDNPQNWKSLVKATGDFHRNFRAFYMMVAYLSGETPREDLSHVEMQMDVRSKLA